MDIEEQMALPYERHIAWRGATIATWIGVVLCLVVIAISSRIIGRPIWWLGPSTNSAPWYYMLLPLILIVMPLEGAFWRSKSTVPACFIGSLGLIATAIPDFSNSPGVAAAICVVGFAALLQSIALLLVTRQYR